MRRLQFYPAAETPGKGKSVRVFKVAAHGEAGGKAGKFRAGIFEQLPQVKGSGIAFDCGIKREYDFFYPAAPDAAQQFSYRKVVGPYPFQRGDKAAQDVKAPPELAGFFYYADVLGPLDNADNGRIPTGVGANGAGIGFSKTAATGTAPYRLMQKRQLFGKGAAISGVGLQYMIGQTGRALFAYARQP
jgi:hypothetical protein